MILFLYGEDSFCVNRRRVALQQAFAKKYTEAEVFVFDFEDRRSLADVREAVSLCEGGLFAIEKLVVMLHPLSLEGEGEKYLLEFHKSFKKDTASKATLLFVEPGKIKKTHRVIKTLLKDADKIEAFEKMSEAEAAAYIKKELKSIDDTMSFSREGLKAFLQVTASDSARMRSELEKLSNFKPGGTIEADDVSVLAAPPLQTTIFDALDDLGRGERGAALRILSAEAAKPEGVFPVLAMCAWYVRTMLLVRDAYDGGVRRAADIALSTRLAPFVVQKALARIEAFPMSRLKRGIALLSESDTKMKTSSMAPQTALDLFVWRF